MSESDVGDRTRLYHKHLEKMSLGRYRVSKRDVCRRPLERWSLARAIKNQKATIDNRSSPAHNRRILVDNAGQAVRMPWKSHSANRLVFVGREA